MPEGHTIHRIARDHTKHFVGQGLDIASPQGRFRDEAATLSGKRLQSVEAKGKHLLYNFGRTGTVHVHLGLYGKFRLHRTPLPEPRGAVRLRMIGEERGFDLNGPNCCELINSKQRRELLERLGHDPLRDDANVEDLRRRIQRSRSAVGSLLLNQAVISGVGNIYRAEALFELGISPWRPGCQLSDEDFVELWSLLQHWMRIGVKYNRIITLPRSASATGLGRLGREERLQIYKKQTCTRCDSPVENAELAARKIYFCPTCQAE